MSPPTERTLIAALIPPQVAHVDTVESLAFASDELLLRVISPMGFAAFRLPCQGNGADRFPRIRLTVLPMGRRVRSGDLARSQACLSYGAVCIVWNSHRARLAGVSWSSSDPRLGVEDTFEVAKHKNWSRSSRTALRLRASAGASRNRRAGRSGAGPYARTAHRDVSYSVPRPRRERARHLVRHERPHRLDLLERPDGDRLSKEGRQETDR